MLVKQLRITISLLKNTCKIYQKIIPVPQIKNGKNLNKNRVFTQIPSKFRKKEMIETWVIGDKE